MPKSGLEGEKESHTILVGNFKQLEDLKMYGQLPDYGEFQRYDLCIDSGLSHIDEKIYADFHKSSCGEVESPFTYGGNSQAIISTSRNYIGEWQEIRI